MSDESFEILKKYHNYLLTAVTFKSGGLLRSSEQAELVLVGDELGIKCTCWSCNEAKGRFVTALGKKYFEEVKRREELEKAKEEQLKEDKDDPYAEFRKPYNPEPNKKKGKK